MLLMILIVKKLFEHFRKKSRKKTKQQKLRIRKVTKKKGNKLYVKWKFPFLKMSQYFLKPYEPFDGDINFKVDLSNYATKAD